MTRFRARLLGGTSLLAALLALTFALGGCGKDGARLGGGREAPSDRAVVSLARVTARTEASADAPAAGTLARGAELRILAAADGFYKAKVEGGDEVFVPAGSFERLSDREARERRAAAVAGFAVQPGRALEDAPILLAPDYGAARWGDLEDGDDVEVLLADHDFYGVKLGDSIGFVPARAIRLLPAPVSAEVPRPSRRRGAPPPIAERAPPVPPESPPAPGREPYELLPVGAEAPVLVSRVEPRYPEMARRMMAEGEVSLKIVVEADGSVGNVAVAVGRHPALVDAAKASVRRWRYRPARVGGRPVSVYKTVKITFRLK